jgi:aspartate/methionine/tyrosine aminotransferase
MTTSPPGPLPWRRMPIERDAPEEHGYEKIRANLAESSFTDLRLGELGVALDDLVLLYGDHRGHPGARAWLADDAPGLAADDVLLTTGAALALFVVHAALLGPGEEVVVAAPNYGTNLETPRVLGARVVPFPLTFDEGFRVDVDRLAATITPRTRLVSLTAPHNPSGVELPIEDLRAILALCARAGCRLLLDQTYRDLSRTERLPLAAALSPAAISVGSLSKSDGAPGIRLGWAITADRALMETLLAVKEQVVLTGSVLDEAVGFELLRRRPARLAAIRAALAPRFARVQAWLADHPHLEWVAPTGGVTGLPRLRDPLVPHADAFHAALRDRGVWVGPGEWFGLERRYFRLGWGWPDLPELERGLAEIDDVLDALARA